MALELWVDFFDELEHVRGRSRNTVMAYRRDLELYEKYCEKQGIKNHAGNDDFGPFYEFMVKNQLSDRSQARVISSIRTYFKFLDEKGLNIPDLRKLKPPKINAKLPEAITVEDFEKLFLASRVENIEKSKRNEMTLLFLFGLGCRVSELIGMNIRDFNQTDSYLTVTGKGGKQRILPLTINLHEALTEYLESIRPELVRMKTPSLLLNDRGNRPSRVDVWRWLSAWSAKAGFDAPISPHKFRHGCATQLLDAGADLRSIQMLLGHSCLQTTQVYTSVSGKHLVETIEKHHPLSKVK